MHHADKSKKPGYRAFQYLPLCDRKKNVAGDCRDPAVQAQKGSQKSERV